MLGEQECATESDQTTPAPATSGSDDDFVLELVPSDASDLTVASIDARAVIETAVEEAEGWAEMTATLGTLNLVKRLAKGKPNKDGLFVRWSLFD